MLVGARSCRRFTRARCCGAGRIPILNLKPPADTGAEQNRRAFDLVQKLNAAQSPGDAELDARIASYELAFRMQQHAPEAVDLRRRRKRRGRHTASTTRRRPTSARGCCSRAGWSNAGCGS